MATASRSEALVTTAPDGSNLPTVASATFAPLEGFDPNSREGKEGIDSSVMRVPFLSIAQKTSKVLDETDGAYVEGMSFGDLYNSDTKEGFGKGPVTFIPLRIRKRAYIPDENGRMGEVIAFTDPRCAWPSEDEKKSGKTKPEGMQVLDFVVLLKVGGGLQLSVVSFKSTYFAAGQILANFVNMIRGASYTAQFTVRSILDGNAAGKWYKLAVAPAGKPTIEEATEAKGWYDLTEGKEIDVNDDTSNETPAGSVAVEGQVVEKKDDEIPF